MKIAHLLTATSIAFASVSAQAATSLGLLNPVGTPSSVTVSGSHPGGLSTFTDEFTFAVSSIASVGASLTEVSLQSFAGLALTSVQLFYQGVGPALQSATITPGSCGIGCTFQVAVLSYQPLLSGASDWYSIKVTGNTTGFPAFTNGSYGGPLTVAPVPEPHEWAMMLAGLGIVGTIAARRRKSIAAA